MFCWIFRSTCTLIFYSQLTSGADINYLRTTITNYFSDNRNHEVNNAYKNAAREFVLQEFKNNGLEVMLHVFPEPDISKKAIFTNVVGMLKGTNFGTKDDKIIGLGAHYDTTQNTKGVDDNGSGVAAMLEVSRQLGSENKKGMKRKNTVMFVAFDLGEYNYIGSHIFINVFMSSWLQQNYGEAARKLSPHGIIVLDTIMNYNTSAHSQCFPPGAEQTFQELFPATIQDMRSDKFRGDFLAMTYRAVPDAALANTMRASWTAETRPRFEFESFALPFADIHVLNKTAQNSFGNFLKSEHYYFWMVNVSAILLTDMANFRGDMISCYHNSCDDLDTMLTDDNLNFLGKTADSVARAMNMLSSPLGTDVNGCVECSVNIRW